MCDTTLTIGAHVERNVDSPDVNRMVAYADQRPRWQCPTRGQAVPCQCNAVVAHRKAQEVGFTRASRLV